MAERIERPTAAPRRDIVVTINGPGEISAWLYPFLSRAHRAWPDAAIRVVLLPCVFSSGVESHVLSGMEGVASVSSVREGLAFALAGRLPDGLDRAATGPVLHFGGEPALSYLLARRLKRPLIAYAEHPFSMHRLFDKVLFAGTHDPTRVALPSGATVIGDLMVDAIADKCPDRATPAPQDAPVIAIYPGSRDYLVKYMLPFFAKAFDLVAAAHPNARAMMALSDFVALDFIRNLPDVRDGRPIDGDNLRFEDSAQGPVLYTSGGNRIAIAKHVDVARLARVGLALPGTTTAELAALGIPTVVALPTHRGDLSPLPGLAGHIGRIPLIGPPIKSALAHAFLARLGFTALPNRRAGRAIVPEIIGPIRAADVAKAVLGVLGKTAVDYDAELRAIMGPAGATDRLIEMLRPFVESAEKGLVRVAAR